MPKKPSLRWIIRPEWPFVGFRFDMGDFCFLEDFEGTIVTSESVDIVVVNTKSSTVIVNQSLFCVVVTDLGVEVCLSNEVNGREVLFVSKSMGLKEKLSIR